MCVCVLRVGVRTLSGSGVWRAVCAAETHGESGERESWGEHWGKTRRAGERRARAAGPRRDTAFSEAVAYHKSTQSFRKDTVTQHRNTEARTSAGVHSHLRSLPPHSLTALAQTVGWGWASARQDGSEVAAGALPLHEWGHAPHPSRVRSRQALVNVLNCTPAGRGPEPAKRAVDGLVRVEVELVVRRLP